MNCPICQEPLSVDERYIDNYTLERDDSCPWGHFSWHYRSWKGIMGGVAGTSWSVIGGRKYNLFDDAEVKDRAIKREQFWFRLTKWFRRKL